MKWICSLVLFAILGVYSLRAQAVSELDERDRIGQVVRSAFATSDVEKLDSMAATFRGSKERMGSGLWRLGWFYLSLRYMSEERIRVVGPESAATEFGQVNEAWEARFPKSPSACISRSIAAIALAGAYRGSGIATTVSESGGRNFRKYIEVAKNNLDQCKSIAASDPEWYTQMTVVARTEGWEREKFDQLLDEAFRKEPYYYQTYFSAVEYLLPQWNGDLGEVDKFARDAARRTGKAEGKGLYARIYWALAGSHYGADLFADTRVDWSTMKVAFDDVIKRYPDDWNVSNFEVFACVKGDRETFARLLKVDHSDARTQLGAYGDPARRQACVDWATGKSSTTPPGESPLR